MEGDAGSELGFLQVFTDCLHNVINVLRGILVFDWFNIEVDLMIFFAVEVVKRVLFRNVIFNRVASHKSSFVSPAASDILNGVSTASKKNHRNAELFHEVEALSVPSDR